MRFFTRQPIRGINVERFCQLHRSLIRSGIFFRVPNFFRIRLVAGLLPEHPLLNHPPDEFGYGGVYFRSLNSRPAGRIFRQSNRNVFQHERSVTRKHELPSRPIFPLHPRHVRALDPQIPRHPLRQLIHSLRRRRISVVSGFSVVRRPYRRKYHRVMGSFHTLRFKAIRPLLTCLLHNTRHHDHRHRIGPRGRGT